MAFLNYRLFAHAVPGAWGQATGCVAVMAEAIALYATHNFSRSASWFRFSLGLFGILLMTFSLVHGTFSILDLIGIADISEAVRYYSRVVAFPLLAGLLGVAVVAITMTHPKHPPAEAGSFAYQDRRRQGGGGLGARTDACSVSRRSGPPRPVQGAVAARV